MQKTLCNSQSGEVTRDTLKRHIWKKEDPGNQELGPEKQYEDFRIVMGPDKTHSYLSRYEELRDETGVVLKLWLPSLAQHHSRPSTPHI